MACHAAVFSGARDEASQLLEHYRNESGTQQAVTVGPWGRHDRVSGNGTVVGSGHHGRADEDTVFSEQSGFRIPAMNPRRGGVMVDCVGRASRFLTDAGIEHSLAYGGVLGLAVYKGVCPVSQWYPEVGQLLGFK